MAFSPSFSAIELEVLGVIGVSLILTGAFFAIFFSAIIGAGVARVLYVGARSSMKLILLSFVPMRQAMAVHLKGAKP